MTSTAAHAGLPKQSTIDGSVIVGTSLTDGGTDVFIWTDVTGMEGLRAIAAEDGLVLPDAAEMTVSSLNGGGNVIVGSSSFGGWLADLNPSPPSTLLSALLPMSRSVEVGTTGTAFASIINTGSEDARGCTINPMDLDLGNYSFQATDPINNQPIGVVNEPVDISAGSTQSFVVSLAPTELFEAQDIAFRFDCNNTSRSSTILGVNTLLLSSTATANRRYHRLGPYADRRWDCGCRRRRCVRGGHC